IAVRAQLLDGSAGSVLDTVRRLGFLQLDPISSVAPPQHLVLWSRLGTAYARGELDRLLWEEKKLVEWRAFVYPMEDLPLLRARMRTVRTTAGTEYLRANASFRRYVLRELERRGPLLSREIETHSTRRNADRHDWWGARQMGLMLEVLAARGLVAVVGRRQGQRVWDIAERWYPADTEKLSWRDAEAVIAEKRWRALGGKLERGRLLVHPEANADPVPATRTTFLSPFDRLIHDRARTEALWGFRYRLEMYVPKAEREYGYYVLPILRGDRIVGRIEPVWNRTTQELTVNGTWWEDGQKPLSLAKPLRDLTSWLASS
ncbi:MAG: YcaQ family DNA glycosylase, partial [Acidobacteriota bacterium]|nr:YcaQ family DNA glycosylase [Acidobacteriota bacterium]